MLYKAAMRLRDDRLKARSLRVHVSFLGRDSWAMRRRIDPVADTPTLLAVMHSLWQSKPKGKILKVGVVLGDVIKAAQIPEHLFDQDRGLLALSQVMDRVNKSYGMRAAYFGSLHGVLQRAPMRIAFNRIPKVELEAMGETPYPTPSSWSGPMGGISEQVRLHDYHSRGELTYVPEEPTLRESD
jgi:hypothetical protein